MVPLPDTGRVFTGQRRVRLGDVDPSGRLRLDALTRYTQDVSNDDTTEVGLADDLAFVVRRTTVDVHRPGEFGEDLTIATFCGRLGRRWAERRLVVTGSGGARYDVATLWVHIETGSGRPRALSTDFLGHYGEAAQGRTVSARHELRSPDKVDVGPLRRTLWPLRFVDFDTFGHMNNAAYWAVIEEQRGDHPIEEPARIVIEYGSGIGPADEVIIVSGEDGDGRQLLWWEVGGQPVASASVESLRSARSANTVDR
jgi:acyl-ACP thioesterase